MASGCSVSFCRMCWAVEELLCRYIDCSKNTKEVPALLTHYVG